MMKVLSTATSGLQAATRRLDTSAHNIANLNTPGFHRHEVKATARAESAGVDTRVERAAQEGVSLEQEVVDQMAAALSFKANAKVIETVARTLGRWVDERV
jgi:flagellar hook-associated protein FlgK